MRKVVFSGPYFTVFGMNAGKYGPEKTPYFDTFHPVVSSVNVTKSKISCGVGLTGIY